MNVAASSRQGPGQVRGEPQPPGQQHGGHRVVIDHRGDARGQFGDDALDIRLGQQKGRFNRLGRGRISHVGGAP